MANTEKQDWAASPGSSNPGLPSQKESVRAGLLFPEVIQLLSGRLGSNFRASVPGSELEWKSLDSTGLCPLITGLPRVWSAGGGGQATPHFIAKSRGP